LADYAARYDEIRAVGAELVAISVDQPNQSERLRRELELPYAILSDADRRVIREWGIYNPRERGGIAKPALFIIDADRKILFESIDGVRTRVAPSEIVYALRTPGVSVPRRKFGYTPRLRDVVRALRNAVTRVS
jgi:peroxiredoxin